MSAAKRALGRAVKVAAAAGDLARPPACGVSVLIYHRVGGGSGLPVDLPAGLFDEQLAMLAERFRPVAMGPALAALATGTEPAGADGRPLVVVTFDDGTADFAEVALPIIERHRIPVTLYVATRFVEERRMFPDDGAPISWAALADACAGGLVEVGSHTHGHQLLDRLPADRVADELDRSIDLIGSRLGRAPLDFAYPKGLPGAPAADRAVRARFRSAALAGTRSNPYGRTDPYRLARSPIQTGDGAQWFLRKAAGGMALEDRLRSALNRRRYAGATS